MSLINSNGIIQTSGNPQYLVPNFTETKSTTGWTLGGSLDSNGVAVLTGSAPKITSTTFTVGENDIIVFEFTVSVPTPSTTTSSPGLYLGTQYGQSTYVHTFNFSSNKWSISSTTNKNPYFISSYNSTTSQRVKTYIFGKSVSVSDFYIAERSSSISAIRAIQLVSDTSTNIRSGYNSNSSMVINFSNPKIYKVTNDGFGEVKGTNAKFNTGFVEANNIIEY